MIDNGADGRVTDVRGGKPLWIQYGVLAATCALVIGVYACTARTSYLLSASLDPADACYNLLVQGFRAGQLSLKKEVPPGLRQIVDPYERAANFPYRVLDLSYYKGKLYLYFGVTPAVLLFWPYVALTGHYLLQRDAAMIFSLIGFLTSARLLCALWRRYFAEVEVGVAAGILALGLATFVPFLLARCDVYEVSISCGYALTMLALAAIWKALHEPERRGRWLAAASLAYGLAVGARPSLLPGAVILLVPVAQAWRERRKVWIPLMSAAGPIVLIGLGLMLYNARRFDDPFEFGWHYQMSGGRQDTVRVFGLPYLWFNLRVFFLEPARWSGRFPYVHDIHAPPAPSGYGGAEHPFGILTNIPLVWLALVVPLAWRNRSAEARSTLCWFLAAVAVLFGICALTLCLHRGGNTRYQVEFMPALVLLAMVGILGLERALAPRRAGQAGRRDRRRAARCGWGFLLGFSVAFNLLASVSRCADAQFDLGCVLLQQGRLSEAIAQYERALRLKPDFADAHLDLGTALGREGKIGEALGHYEQALRIKPDFAEAHYGLAVALEQAGQVPDALGHYEQALRLKPDYAEARNNLGNALLRRGQVSEAIAHYEQAVRSKPDSPDAQLNLGNALFQQGRMSEAIAHYERALRIRPDSAEAHYNLGVVLSQTGGVNEAIVHYEQALRIRPDFAEAHYNLGNVLLQQHQASEAIAHYEQALRLKPGYAETHLNLGTALEQVGRVQEAIGHYEQALQLKPDCAEARNSLARLRAVQ